MAYMVHLLGVRGKWHIFCTCPWIGGREPALLAVWGTSDSSRNELRARMLNFTASIIRFLNGASSAIPARGVGLMYEQRFGLKARPFPPTPDTALYYPATLHESALATLGR